VTLEKLPVTPSGKLDRRALPAPEQGAYVVRKYEAPQGAVEETLASIWQTLLKVERVGRHDNFFELGGHSLLGIKLITQIGERLQERPSVVAIFKSPTIAEMAKALDALRSRNQPRSSIEFETAAPESRSRRAPLGSSQLAHWHVYQLASRPAIRQIASATRIQGRLDIDALRRSLAEAIRRHDALRTRIIVVDGAPVQEILPPGGFELGMDDLTSLPEQWREREIQQRIHQQILEPIELAAGPLFEARLLRTSDDEHVLILVMEHIVSDAFSMSILLREVFEAYAQIVQGEALSLPKIEVQPADYAIAQRSWQTRWTETNGTHWRERLTECPRLTFPDETPPQTTESGWGNVPVRIDARLKRAIDEYCRSQGTTLPMTVFAAFAAALLRTGGASKSVIQYQTDGRVSPEVEHTVGYLASSLYLRIELQDDDRFVDFMKRVTAEYCAAYERPDFCLVGSDGQGPEFSRAGWFNWVPHVPDIEVPDPEALLRGIVCSQIAFEHPMIKRIDRDNDPVLLIYDGSDDAAGNILFPQKRFSVAAIERLQRIFMQFLQSSIEQPERRVKDVIVRE
jgi:hypothetical protein